MNETPSVVSDALLAQPTFVGQLQLQPLSLGAYLFLEKIGSPIVKGGSAKMSSLDMFRALFSLVTPLPDCLSIWSQGEEVYDAAVIGFSQQVEFNELPTLADKIVKHIEKAFSTTAKTKPKSDGDETSPLRAATPPATG